MPLNPLAILILQSAREPILYAIFLIVIYLKSVVRQTLY